MSFLEFAAIIAVVHFIGWLKRRKLKAEINSDINLSEGCKTKIMEGHFLLWSFIGSIIGFFWGMIRLFICDNLCAVGCI